MRTLAGSLPALFVLALIVLVERPAQACTLVPIEDHELDAAHAGDTVAPSAVMASALVERQDTDQGCGAQSKCGGGAWITIAVSSTDNATAVDKLGYELRIINGEPPDGLTIPTNPVTPVGGQLYFYFNAEDRNGFQLDIQLRARDLNGNLGPATVVTVGEPAEGGCATNKGSLVVALLVFVALLARRR
jgi:uncharacterized protein (TIGR03382 family)